MTPTKNPAFISFVGKAPQTDRLYEALEAQARKQFSHLRYEFLGNPFEHYSTMRIDEKPKHDYSPAARTFFRLGLFYEFNETVVKPAFDRGLDFVVTRAYGFDLYRDAIEYRDCDKALKIHKDLIPYTVLGLGLCPPEYVFLHEISPVERIKMDRYFAEGSGQTKREFEPSLPMDEKVNRVIAMIKNGMHQHKETQVA